MASENKGLRRVMLAAGYSWQGLKTCYRKEAAFRQELWLVMLLAPLGFWLGDTGVERALLMGSLMLVLVVELLNTGLENAIDRVGFEPHKLSGRAKDMGSAAVMTTLLMTAMIWALILLDH
ncbi:MAG: diacylglycerol kinase [Halothiobacillaceae bacterium]|jgi:diacylglycerol kinase (ATP)|nr:MAG: diacylglycerol kinase [Halothiobacillaceae bacterium]